MPESVSRRELVKSVGGAVSLLALASPAGSETSVAEGKLGIGSQANVLAVEAGEVYDVTGTEQYRKAAIQGTVTGDGTLQIT